MRARPRYLGSVEEIDDGGAGVRLVDEVRYVRAGAIGSNVWWHVR